MTGKKVHDAVICLMMAAISAFTCASVFFEAGFAFDEEGLQSGRRQGCLDVSRTIASICAYASLTQHFPCLLPARYS